MPSNQNVDPFQYTGNSGQNLSGVVTANVPLNESTGSQYQAAPWSESTYTSGFQSIAQEVNEIATESLVIGLGQSGANIGGYTLLGTTPQVFLPMSGGSLAGGISISGLQPGGLVIEGIVAASGIGGSGFAGNQAATIYGSGFASSPLAASTSGAFAPAGYFTIQVLGLSGNPFMKVPFFNS